MNSQMSIKVVTNVGSFSIRLFTESAPVTCMNFIKLSKLGYYNGCPFHKIIPDFVVQDGDPTGTGGGGCSFYGFLFGEEMRYIPQEFIKGLKHDRVGMVGMAGSKEGNSSQFYITLGPAPFLYQKHAIFGEVSEGLAILKILSNQRLNRFKPLHPIRIKDMKLFGEDPFEDPQMMSLMDPDCLWNGIKPCADLCRGDDTLRLVNLALDTDEGTLFDIFASSGIDRVEVKRNGRAVARSMGTSSFTIHGDVKKPCQWNSC